MADEDGKPLEEGTYEAFVAAKYATTGGTQVPWESVPMWRRRLWVAAAQYAFEAGWYAHAAMAGLAGKPPVIPSR